MQPEHTIAREEIFGPVLAIQRAKDFEDAMRLANNTPFGLVFLDPGRPPIFRAPCSITCIAAEAGLLTINLPSAGVEYQLPFGGTKDS